MNFRKLLTYLTMGTAAAMPLAVAQNPTILQGNYISNVFGNSNFVLNPNAQTNVANVTNATRSTTTPLVATSEFTLSLASGANATWTLRAFDSGMKGQNCEARFTYRGFATATTKAEIVQNSLVVASLTLTPTTDPRIASINFPCGDLVNATTFRIAQTTANMTGTNEIGGIYVGLATNMANVAQAELVGKVLITGCSTYWQYNNNNNYEQTPTNAPTGCNYNAAGFASAPSTNRPGIRFSSLPPGNYQIVFNATMLAPTSTSAADMRVKLTDGTNDGAVVYVDAFNNQSIIQTNSTAHFSYSSAQSNIEFRPSIRTASFATAGARIYADGNIGTVSIAVYRFPSSSELVVTPERQNVFGSIDGTGLDHTTTSTSFVTPSGFTITGTQGKCQADGTNLACKISTLSPGTYKIDVTLPYIAVAGSVSQNCLLQIKDNKGIVDAVTGQASASVSQTDAVTTVSRTIRYAAVQSDIVFSFQHRQSTGTGGSCGIYTNGANRYWQMTVTPLDQPSNSALYVQGPVKAAETGAAIPASYVGQKVTWTTPPSTVAPGTSYVDWTNATFTVQPGVWLLLANINAQGYADASGNDVECRAKIVDSSGNLIENQEKSLRVRGGSSAGAAQVGRAVLSYAGVVNVTSATTYKIQVRLADNAGINNACTFYNASTAYSEFFAIRLN